MSRHLSKKQQKYLDSLIDGGIDDIDDLTADQFRELENMNNFETLYQRATIYIWDRKMESTYGRASKNGSSF